MKPPVARRGASHPWFLGRIFSHQALHSLSPSMLVVWVSSPVTVKAMPELSYRCHAPL